MITFRTVILWFVVIGGILTEIFLNEGFYFIIGYLTVRVIFDSIIEMFGEQEA